MSRRQQSKQFKIIEPAIGLAALILFLYFFSPDFRAGIQILFAFIVVFFLIWLAYKIINPELTPTHFKMHTPDTSKEEASISLNQPTALVENIQPARLQPETGYFSEAKQLADKHDNQIITEPGLIEMLEESGQIHSKEISKLFSGEKKFCPKCENEMVVRTNRQKGDKF